MLFVVPTPIGNLDDITLRAIKLFKSADIIICEDGRQTRKLLQLLEIENKPKYVDITKNHQLNWSGIYKVINELIYFPDKNVLLVSDSGTPGISDPGRDIILKFQDEGIKTTVLPGATAVIPAVVGSGLVTKEFEFLGFLPVKKGRLTQLKSLNQKTVPVVIYESSHRIKKLIGELDEYLNPDKMVYIVNDITKYYEKTWKSTVSELKILDIPEKGEFVVVIGS